MTRVVYFPLHYAWPLCVPFLSSFITHSHMVSYSGSYPVLVPWWRHHPPTVPSYHFHPFCSSLVWSSQLSPSYSPLSLPYFRLFGFLSLSGSCPGSILQACPHITTLPGLSLGFSGFSSLSLIVLLGLPSYRLCCCWCSYILDPYSGSILKLP